MGRTLRQILSVTAVGVCFLLLFSGCQGSDFLAYWISPTPTASLSPTVTPVTPSATASITLTPSLTLTSSVTASLTPVPSETFTLTPTETETVTPGPSPTASKSPTITRTPTRTRRPTLTPSITLTRTPSPTPTITNTPTPPLAYLRLQQPGRFSKLTSPFLISMVISPGDDGYVYVDVIGEDGRKIRSEALDYRRQVGRRLLVSPKLDFTIPGAVETARLVVSIKDSANRLIALNSSDLLLLSIGKADIYPVESLYEPYIIRFPRPKQTLSGGIVTLVGLARPVNDNPLIIELVDETGKVVGATSITVPAPTGDLSHTPFEVGVPYQIEETTPVRLTIRQESTERIPGTVMLSSMEITLEP